MAKVYFVRLAVRAGNQMQGNNKETNPMNTNGQRSWQSLTLEKRNAIYHSLKWRTVGSEWIFSQLFEVAADEDIKRAKTRIILSNLHRSFRYLILNETIRGSRLGWYGQKDRRRKRDNDIWFEAYRISKKTGVNFKKVYPVLSERMRRFID